jgi:hypothetical protein
MLANDLKLVTKEIAAEVFSVSVKTIDNYIKDGLLPPPKRFVSKEYWHPDDFRTFLARTFQAAAEANDRAGAIDALPASATEEPAAPLGVRGRKLESTKDTNPMVRQRARGKELLKRLNAPG